MFYNIASRFFTITTDTHITTKKIYDCTCILVKLIFILFYIICVLISPSQIINNHNCNRKTCSIVLIYYATNNIIYFYTSSQKISDIEQKQITVNIYFTPQIIRVVSYIIPYIDLIVRIILMMTHFYVHVFMSISLVLL